MNMVSPDLQSLQRPSRLAVHQYHARDVVQNGTRREQPFEVDHVIGQHRPLDVAPDDVTNAAAAAVGPAREAVHLTAIAAEPESV